MFSEPYTTSPPPSLSAPNLNTPTTIHQRARSNQQPIRGKRAIATQQPVQTERAELTKPTIDHELAITVTDDDIDAVMNLRPPSKQPPSKQSTTESADEAIAAMF
jgi:hypothetical protein